MRRNPVLLLIAVSFLCGCRGNYSNITSYRIQHEEYDSIVVIRQAWNYPIGLVDRKNNLRIVRADLDILGQVERIILSPNGKLAIIISYGEGHQFLSVYRIDDIVTEFDNCGKFLKAVYTLDPYPYAFGNIAWVSDDKITFSSVSDFSKFDRKNRRGAYSPDVDDELERRWVWNIETDTFR